MCNVVCRPDLGGKFWRCVIGRALRGGPLIGIKEKSESGAAAFLAHFWPVNRLGLGSGSQG